MSLGLVQKITTGFGVACCIEITCVQYMYHNISDFICMYRGPLDCRNFIGKMEENYVPKEAIVLYRLCTYGMLQSVD
jgi:hypothetical protein